MKIQEFMKITGQLCFSRRPGPFDELDKADSLPMAKGPECQAKGSGGFSLTIARKN
jgi:hypothetical protein